MADLKALAEASIKGDQNTAVDITKTALDEGTPAKSVLEEGLIAGMDVIGERFKKNEVYIPEVLIAARAMKSSMEILEPELVKAGVKPVGKFVVGTAQGDLHDIGKNLVIMMLKGSGFDVIDLGTNIKPEDFVAAIQKYNPDIIGLSALLTTTMPKMEETVEAIKEAGVRDQVKIMAGGAPVTQEFIDKIGADAYGANAATATEKAKELVA